jgi:hypothetical protein
VQLQFHQNLVGRKVTLRDSNLADDLAELLLVLSEKPAGKDKEAKEDKDYARTVSAEHGFHRKRKRARSQFTGTGPGIAADLEAELQADLEITCVQSARRLAERPV